MGRRGLCQVAWWSVVALGCGDDGAIAESGSTGTGQAETTAEPATSDDFTGTDSISSVGSADTSSGTTSSPTTSDATTTDTTTTVDESSTGGLVDPFGPSIVIPLDLDFVPLALEPGDFDGDGIVDLLITGTDGGTVVGATMLGDGNGGFAAPVAAGISACSAFGVVGHVDDAAGDDMFFGVCDGDGVFWGGQPGGTFTALDVLPDWAGAPVVGSRFADVDGDGDDDLAVFTNALGLQLHVAEHDVAPWAVGTRDVDGSAWDDLLPSRFRIADLDADATLDAVFVAQGEGVAVVLDIDDAPVAVPLPVEISPWSAELADLEGDGDVDIVVTSLDDHATQTFLGYGDGDFEDAGMVELGDLAPFELALGDFDGDATLDGALIDADNARLAYGAGEQLVFRPLGATAVRLHARDLDGNGTDDLIAATFEAGAIEVLLSGR